MAIDPSSSGQNIPRWWRRRWFKAIVVTIVCLTAFYVIERQLGEAAWRTYQKEAAAKAIKIRLADYETPTIPDADNFAAVPIFRDLFNDPKALDRTTKLLRMPPWPSRKNKEPVPDYLTGWHQAFVKAGWIRAEGDNAASDVLAGLERMEPTLSEIRLACARPKTQWPIKWSDGVDTKAPILETLDGAGTVFGLRASALLEVGRSDEALDEISHIARLAESLNGQPGLLFGTTRNRLWDLALERTEAGLKANQWSATQLGKLSDLFRKPNHLAICKVSANGDRCMMNAYLDRLMAADSASFGNQILLLFSYGSPNSSFNKLSSVAPRGWIRQAQQKYNRRFDAELEEIDSVRERISPDFADESWAAFHKQLPLAEYYPAGRLIDAGIGFRKIVTIRAFALHTRAQQFPILCALVNYREARGEFPESLDQLVPSFLDTVPHDIMDGRPMRYRRLENGGCLVWSIGQNRVDEGGKKPDPKRHQSRGPDWVGELPPLKTNGEN